MNIWFSSNIDKKMEDLKPIFLNWQGCIGSYGAAFADSKGKWVDVPYWWGERQNINILSAAIWKSNGATRVEYDKGENKRGDLLFSFKRNYYLVEAKHVDADIGSVNTDLVEGKLREAEGQLRQYSDELYPANGIALLFLDISVQKQDSESSNKLLKKLIDELQAILEKNQNSFWLSCFSMEARKLTEYGHSEETIWPGIICMGYMLKDRIPS